MKRIFLLLTFFIVLSCEDKEDHYFEPINDISACGVDDPLNQLDWLNDIASQSLSDNTGNYIGSIWILSHENTDIIVTDMALGSGGILYHFFNCNGKPINSTEGLDMENLAGNLTDSNLIFSTINK